MSRLRRRRLRPTFGGLDAVHAELELGETRCDIGLACMTLLVIAAEALTDPDTVFPEILALAEPVIESIEFIGVG